MAAATSPKLDLSRVEKKVREAAFFLDKMREREGIVVGDREHFDFYLSAFLSAGRSVDYRLVHEQRAKYDPWRKAWNAAQPEDDKLLQFLHDDRNVEVHRGGSTREQKDTKVPLASGASRTDAGGTITISGPPGMTDAAILHVPEWYFRVDGTERKATEVCAEYVGVLVRMVKQFGRDHL